MRSRRPRTVLTKRDLRPILSSLDKVNRRLARDYPGDPVHRQPVHTVYGGAHLFREETAQRCGAVALAALDQYAPDARSFAEAIGLSLEGGDPTAHAERLRARVVDKLRTEPVEDFRIDFEDGYGIRGDAEEDGHAEAAALAVGRALASGSLPPFIGIRVKPMSRETHARSVRTLDLFLSALVDETRGRLPPNFAVAIPKLLSPEHVAAVAAVCAGLERRLKLRAGSITLELMIETPQSIVGADGRLVLRPLVAAGRGRVVSVHFGAYDYTALCGISAAWQSLRHPACDAARHIMHAALAQSGVRLSDGATTILPVPPHRAVGDSPLGDHQRAENRDTVHRAWKVHFADVTHALVNGFYQGWDLHPAQLPTRYAALYEFFHSARPAATTRLRTFVDNAAQATVAGAVFDDAATGQGLLNFFLRGLNSDAITAAEAAETGLTAEDLSGRSFAEIVKKRGSW
jgi:citrate lyase beta subunit